MFMQVFVAEANHSVTNLKKMNPPIYIYQFFMHVLKLLVNNNNKNIINIIIAVCGENHNLMIFCFKNEKKEK